MLATVVGSGIMGKRLAGGNVAIAFLANTIATGAVLVCLIVTFGKVSSHFNPAVTAVSAWLGQISFSEVIATFDLLTVILFGDKYRGEAVSCIV